MTDFECARSTQVRWPFLKTSHREQKKRERNRRAVGGGTDRRKRDNEPRSRSGRDRRRELEKVLTDPLELRVFQFAVRDHPALGRERQQDEERAQHRQAHGRQTVPGLGHGNRTLTGASKPRDRETRGAADSGKDDEKLGVSGRRARADTNNNRLLRQRRLSLARVP